MNPKIPKPADVQDAICCFSAMCLVSAEKAKEPKTEEDFQYQLLCRLSDILNATANALHGGSLKDGHWSWHDLPELAQSLRARVADLESRQP